MKEILQITIFFYELWFDTKKAKWLSNLNLQFNPKDIMSVTYIICAHYCQHWWLVLTCIQCYNYSVSFAPVYEDDFPCLSL